MQYYIIDDYANSWRKQRISLNWCQLCQLDKKNSNILSSPNFILFDFFSADGCLRFSKTKWYLNN